MPHNTTDPPSLADVHLSPTALSSDETSKKAANQCPLPLPGYRTDGASLVYVTARGAAFLVRDQRGRVQLTPTRTLPSMSLHEDEIRDIKVITVVEAADQLDECVPEGIYLDAGHYYLRDGEDVVMFYGDALVPVRMPCLPPYASRLDVIPTDVEAAVLLMKESA